jgi:osmotically inducible protein OsmC
MAVSRAQASWSGDLAGGSGTVSAESGVFTDLGLTWAGRTERPAGSSSPEELLAAAHAGCYAMALSNTLAEAGHVPARLEVSATVHFTPQDGGGFAVDRSELSVKGDVPGVDATRFEELARLGEQGCPVSNLFRGNAEISVAATLA